MGICKALQMHASLQIHNQGRMSQDFPGKEFGRGKLRNGLIQTQQDQGHICYIIWQNIGAFLSV